jgi:hypothetical protein
MTPGLQPGSEDSAECRITSGECERVKGEAEKHSALGTLHSELSTLHWKVASRSGAAPDRQIFGHSTARWCPAFFVRRVLFPLAGKCPFAARASRRKEKIKHLLAIYSTPTRSFTAAVSVFRGTPPPKPFDCKSGPNSRDTLDGDRRAHPTGGEPRLSRVPIRAGIPDIS